MSVATIKSVRTVLVHLPLARPLNGPFGRLEARHNLVVIVETSHGARGIGEVWSNFPPGVAASARISSSSYWPGFW